MELVVELEDLTEKNVSGIDKFLLGIRDGEREIYLVMEEENACCKAAKDPRLVGENRTGSKLFLYASIF